MKSVRSLRRRFRKGTRPSRLQYLALTAAAAFLAERVAANVITQGWRLTRGEDPPRNPERLEVTWPEAIGWTAVTGLVVALAGLVARRGAAVGWKRVTGRRIPA
jgi:hypothetical protein